MNKPPPKKPSLIDRTMKTELDRRIERLREYLIHQEELTPLARFEYAVLMAKMTKEKK